MSGRQFIDRVIPGILQLQPIGAEGIDLGGSMAIPEHLQETWQKTKSEPPVEKRKTGWQHDTEERHKELASQTKAQKQPPQPKSKSK